MGARRFQLTPDQVRERSGALVEIHAAEFVYHPINRVLDSSNLGNPMMPVSGDHSETRSLVTIERKPDRANVHHECRFNRPDQREMRMADAKQFRWIGADHLNGLCV